MVEILAETHPTTACGTNAHPPHQTLVSLGWRCCNLEADLYCLLTQRKYNGKGVLRETGEVIISIPYLAKAFGHVYNPRRAG